MDHQTFAQLLGSYGEFVGAIAVVATLIYFSVQLKQTANSIKSSVAALGSGWSAQVWQLPIDKPELADMLQRGDQGTQDLTENEYYRYVHFTGSYFRSFEQYYILHELGTLSDDQWSGWQQPLSQMLQYPGVRQVWATALRGQHSKSFTELVDRLIDSDAPPGQGRLFSKPGVAD